MCKKSLLSMMLAFIMIISSFTMMAVANESEVDVVEQVTVSEISKESPYCQAITVLSALRIMKNKSETEFNSEELITRAEMCAVVLRLIGFENVSNEIPNVGFRDVADDHWAKDYINMAEKLDIIHGNGDGYFEPEESVTVEQAIKIIVGTLGYNPKALAKGGYPVGYISVANELKLFDNMDVPGDYNSPITKGQLAILVYNALDVDIMDITSYGNNNSSTVLKDTNLLEKYHKVEKKNGTIVSTCKASLNNKLSDFGEVMLDDIKYVTDLDMSKYVGYNVDFYCTIEDRNVKSKIIAFFLMPNITKSTETNIDDVESICIGADLSVDVKYYEEAGRKLKSVSLKKPIILYNGKMESFENATNMQDFIDKNMNQGKLVMLRNEKSGYRDVLVIENYEAYVVAAVSEENEIIRYFSYKVGSVDNLTLDLSTEDDKRIFIYDEKDNVITIGDLVKNDVIMVYESSDKSIYKIYQSKKQVGGTVEMRRTVSKAVETEEEPELQPQWQDCLTIDFSSYTTNTSPSSSGNTPYEGIATSSNGDTYDVTVPKGDWHRVGQYNTFKIPSSDEADGIPDIFNTNVFQIDRKHVGTWGGTGAGYPPSSNGMEVYGNFEDIKPKDKIRVTAYLKTKNVFVYNGYKNNTKPTEIADQANATSVITMTLGGESAETLATAVNSEFPNQQWSTISCEYTVDPGKKISKIGIMSNAEVGKNYAQTTLVAGIKIEKYVYPEGWTPPPLRPEIAIDNSEYEFFINNEWYESTVNFPIGLLEIGSETTILLDRNNKIAGYIKGLDKSGYALLMDVGIKKGAFNDCLIIKMLDADNTINIYETTEEVIAYDGTKITTVSATQLVTNEPADPMTSHYLWSTNNASNFQAVNRTWLSDDDKSKAASRKIVYYKTNSEGKIHTIIVPSTPEDLEGAKICMVRNFEANKGSEGNLYHVSSGKFFAVYSTKDRQEYFYPYDANALMYVAMAMNYDESDYTASTASGLYATQRIGSKSFYNGQLYRKPGSSTIDFMVMNPYAASNKLEQIAIVDFVSETADGYYLRGWIPTSSAGNVTNDFKKKIKTDLRVLENIWVTDIDKNVGVTLNWNNVGDYIGLKPSLVSYESDYMGGMETPYVSPKSLHRGDVVGIIEENGEIIYLDIKRRAETGLCVDTDFMHEGSISTMLNPNNGYVCGEITSVNQTLGVFEVTGYYWAGQENTMSTAETKGPSPYTSGAIKKIKMSVSPGRQIAVFDMETGSYRTATFRDYKVGDHFYGRGRADNLKMGVVFENGSW